MNYPSISIDTYDLVIITALIGGFWTGEWVPFTIFLIWEFLKQWIEFEALKERLPPTPINQDNLK